MKLTEKEFQLLSEGDAKSLEKVFVEHYAYVTGFLIYKQSCDADDVQDIYADAILKFRSKAMEGKLVYGNSKAYLLRTAINLLNEKRRKKQNELKRYEIYVSEDALDNKNHDLLEADEEAKIENREKARRAKAIILAMQKLDKICRELLTDTIVKGLKVGSLVEKYGFKNARVVTDKKGRCKKELMKKFKDLKT